MTIPVSERAQTLHDKMMALPDKLYSQEALQELLQTSDLTELLELVQELMTSKYVKLVKEGGELRFQAISIVEASKFTSMSDDEAMIYSYIEASGREGIWTKTIKAKTNLHQHIVARCLKSLENQRYIKSIKSVKHPTRKIYMLYNLQPSIEVTGGPWFTDSELDTEFIDSLVSVIWRFVASKTYPAAFQPPSPNVHPVQAMYPTSNMGLVNINEILDFISSNNISNVELVINDIRALNELLIYDDKLEALPSVPDTYRATWLSVLEAGFGRAYEEDPNIAPDFKKLLQNKSSSIFEHFKTIDTEPHKEVAYFDAWALN